MQLSITKEEIRLLPLIQFEGELVVITNKQSLNEAVAELNEHKILGIDTESRPSFKRREYYPTSLIQLSTGDKCFLIRSLITGLTDPLIGIFENRSILKIGVALHDDIKDLRKTRDFEARGFVDLNTEATKMGIKNIGVKNLSGIFLKGRVSKNQQTSNWENSVLTDAQLLYAATDAWACLKIYEKMFPRSSGVSG